MNFHNSLLKQIWTRLRLRSQLKYLLTHFTLYPWRCHNFLDVHYQLSRSLRRLWFISVQNLSSLHLWILNFKRQELNFKISSMDNELLFIQSHQLWVSGLLAINFAELFQTHLSLNLNASPLSMRQQIIMSFHVF